MAIKSFKVFYFLYFACLNNANNGYCFRDTLRNIMYSCLSSCICVFKRIVYVFGIVLLQKSFEILIFYLNLHSGITMHQISSVCYEKYGM